MIKIKEAVICEGKYDKIKLKSIIDAVIIETDGFSVFTDREKQALIKKLAAATGVVVITDSDSAGFKIRHFIGGMLPKEQVKHVYIPEIFGKEKRKLKYSCEGMLGVEGVPKKVILKSLETAGITCGESIAPGRKVTKADFYDDGLTGGGGSAEKRRLLLQKLGLPSKISANALIDILNATVPYEEYKRLAREIALNRQ